MSKEIKELDDKYLVLKWEDIRQLKPSLKAEMNILIDRIQENRYNQKKTRSNEYLILNLDDDIDLMELLINLQNSGLIKIIEGDFVKENVKVKDIAVDLVNAILKTKE